MKYVALMTLAAFGAASRQLDSQAPAFEVASVKVAPAGAAQSNTVGVIGGPGTADPTRIQYRLPMLFLLLQAYQTTVSQLSGPDWINSAMYDIEARVPPRTTKEQCALMLRRLLEERFGMQTHRESRELPSYLLRLSKNGPKLQLHTGGTQRSNTVAAGYPEVPAGRLLATVNGHTSLRAEDKDMAWLTGELTGLLGRPVRDETGLRDRYDFALHWLTEPYLARADADPGPSLTQAVEEQLGLAMQEKREPVEVIIVDRLEKIPAAN